MYSTLSKIMCQICKPPTLIETKVVKNERLKFINTANFY